MITPRSAAGFAAAAFFAFSFFAPPPVHARQGACGGVSDHPIVKLLPPPPCETCAETKAELGELLDLQRARTEAQSNHAVADAERSVAAFLKGAGIGVDEAKLDACKEFFEARRRDEHEAVEAAKNAFCRTRPYNFRDSELKPLASVGFSYSYPSGHATYGALVGFILAEMLPEKRADILARIGDYAHSRMVAGVHFRSDVEAGKLTGAAIAASLFAKESFKREFEGAKACVRNAVGL